MILKSGYGYSVDIWPIGVLLFEFLANALPFGEDDETKVTKRVLALDICWPGEGIFSNAARNLISDLLVKDPSECITLEDIMMHSFIVEGKNAAS